MSGNINNDSFSSMSLTVPDFICKKFCAVYKEKTFMQVQIVVTSNVIYSINHMHAPFIGLQVTYKLFWYYSCKQGEREKERERERERRIKRRE